MPLSPWGLSTGMSAAQLSLLLAPRPPTIPAVSAIASLPGPPWCQSRFPVDPWGWNECSSYRSLGCKGTCDLWGCSAHEVPPHAIQCSDCDWQASATNPTLSNHLVHVCRGTIQGFCPSMMRICNIFSCNAGQCNFRTSFACFKKNTLLPSKSSTERSQFCALRFAPASVTLLSMHNRQKLNCYDDATDTACMLEEHLTLATCFVKNTVQGLDQDVHARNCLGQNLLWQWPEAIRHRRHVSLCALLQGPEVDLLQRRLHELIATANCEKTVTVAQLKKATKCRASPKVILEALRKRNIIFRKLREKGPLK